MGIMGHTNRKQYLHYFYVPEGEQRGGNILGQIKTEKQHTKTYKIQQNQS